MKKKKKYESPRIEFHDLQLKEEIANQCWGGSGKGVTWYYDTDGPGFVSFQSDANLTGRKKDQGNNCGDLYLCNVRFYTDKSDKVGTPIDSNNPKYTEFYNALEDELRNSGGNAGNPFKGENGKFPTYIKPGFS